MVQIVAIECSTTSASVALLRGTMLVERRFPADSKQSDSVLSAVDTLLRSSGTDAGRIDAVAVAIGPGAFTGVRLAIAAAQGLALAWGVPVIPVSTLAALAAQAIPAASGLRTTVFATLDARMGEIYGGWFDVSSSSVVALGDEFVVAPNRVARPGSVDAFAIIGRCFAMYETQLVGALGTPAFVDSDAVPTAGHVANLAAREWPRGAMAPDAVEAAYLRNKVALTSVERAFFTSKTNN